MAEQPIHSHVMDSIIHNADTYLCLIMHNNALICTNVCILYIKDVTDYIFMIEE
jgi:hypothetical protein